LPSVIQNCNILLFADDVKLFYTFSTDPSPLQNDLDNLVNWCTINLMKLNIKKCKQMTFCRTSCISFNYTINNSPLEPGNIFKDLGVLMDPKLCFTPHIKSIVCSASRTLGFIKRWAKEFNDPYATKLLFVSIVRPILEYASIVWCPRYNCYIECIESVQKQFLLFCLRNLNWDPNIPLPAYKSRLKLINLPTLESRRIMLNVSFVLSLLNGNTSCEFLLQKMNFSIPIRPSRNFMFFKLEYFMQNYLNFDPFRASLVDFNNHYSALDFHMTSFSIKRSILSALNN